MKIEVSREFLDGVHLQKPKLKSQQDEIKANAQMQFLPSSPDGTMHTAVVTISFATEHDKNPFAYGGWRFLFTSDEAFNPQEDPNNHVLRNMLVSGSSKVMAVLNPLCLHGNMPLIPFEASAIARATAAQAQTPETGAAETGAAASTENT